MDCYFLSCDKNLISSLLQPGKIFALFFGKKALQFNQKKGSICCCLDPEDSELGQRLNMQAQTQRLLQTFEAHAASSIFEPTRRMTGFLSIHRCSIGSRYVKNVHNVCEHNLEAHFLCNRTGALCQAEWSSHLRKTQDTIFSKLCLSLNAVMSTSKYTTL